MVDLIRRIELKHQDYINWLESQKGRYDIAQFISYVKDKKSNYNKYKESCNVSLIDELPRSMNRYLDEFVVDFHFTKQSNRFTNELAALINKLIRDYPA